MTLLRTQVDAWVSQNLAPEVRSKLIAERAESDVAGLISSGRASPIYRRFVDGVADAPATAVRSTGGGSILYQFKYLPQAAAFVLAFLQSRAPVRTGEFKASFFVAVDGNFIRADQFQPESLASGVREILIGNTEPDDRKIDVQVAGKTVLHFSRAAGMYDDAARALRRQYGTTIQVTRLPRLTFPGAYVLRRGSKRGSTVDSPGLSLIPVV